MPVAWEKQTAMVPSASAMVVEPSSRSGRRPTLSISVMAMTVTTTLVTEVMTVMVRASDSSKPTERHSVVE